MDYGDSTVRQTEWVRLRAAAEAELARGPLCLGLKSPLRAFFNADKATNRAQELSDIFLLGAGAFVVAILLLNLLFTPSPSWTAVGLLCSVTPFLALSMGYLAFRPENTALVREGGALAASCLYSFAFLQQGGSFPPGIASAIIPSLASLSVIAVLFFVKLRFSAALSFVAITTAAQALLLLARPDLPLESREYSIGFLLAVSLPALMAVHRTERTVREVYLRGLLQGLQIEQLAFENGMLSQLSTTDVVTGAANRRQLDNALRLLCAEPPNGDFLLLADIDYFKRFNDRNGHLAGDACLRDVVASMRFQLRRSDLVARFGGEEFAIVLSRTTRADAVATAERIRAGVAAHGLAIDGRLERVTVSIGVAERLAGTTPSMLIAQADGALYAAKRGGRNCVRYAAQARANVAA